MSKFLRNLLVLAALVGSTAHAIPVQGSFQAFFSDLPTVSGTVTWEESSFNAFPTSLTSFNMTALGKTWTADNVGIVDLNRYTLFGGLTDGAGVMVSGVLDFFLYYDRVDSRFVSLLLTGPGMRDAARSTSVTSSATRITVPEPATIGLLSVGLAGMAAFRRRRPRS